MNLFRNIGILGSLVLIGLAGCSSAANDAGRNTAPLAKDVTLSASEPPAHIGTVLNASYRYVDTDGDSESGTLKVWLRNGKPIAGADQDNYTATLADSGKKLQFRVTPAAASGESPGAAVLSEELTIENSPPSVTNVVIGGSVNGQADGTAPLTVSYNFQDLDGDGEDAPTYEWRQNGKAIIGDERNKSYTLKQADAGTTLTVVVTPHARTGASPGLPVESNPVKVATPKVELSVSAGLKQLHFSWYPVKAVTKITYYRVSYNPDGVSGFVRLAKDSDNLTGTTYDWDIAVHRINWPKAQFMLEACDANNACTPSASISALNVMLGTIGYFKASNTGSYDTFGTSVALSGDGNTLAVGAPGEDSAATGIGGNQSDDCTTSQLNCATNSGAVYVYARSGGTWTQQAYVKASNTGTDDSFGTSVALSADGNTLAVGAWGEASAATGIDNTTPGPADNSFANAGAVYVYTRNNSSGLWSQQTYVKASNTGAADQFGRSVALSGDGHTLVVGASSEASANTGITLGAPSEATTGNGARFSGAVYVYSRSGITWTQQAYVKASNTEAGDFFGTSLALSGDGLTLAVGAYGEDSAATGINNITPGPADNSVNAAGAVYVYSRSGSGLWSQQAYVKASNTGANDRFGTSVTLSADGNTLAVGAWGEDSANINGDPVDDCNAASPANCAINSGAVYVYTRSGATWTQQAYLKASNARASDYFGTSVALSADGLTLAVGADYEDSAATGIGGNQSDDCTTSRLNCAANSGAVYVYARSGGAWTQQAYVKASNTETGDDFGGSVALSGDGSTLAVGAYGEDSAAPGVNNTVPGQGDNSASGAGAVYLY